ncbi:MAG TPA: hypothetical protein PKD59_13175 [Miltoncostaeaceae bacterium]|nr:hypothetical protein [Miltoncostaeaceae bacterium]
MLAAEESIPPGQLSPESRRAATQAAVRLLGTYFADAPTWDLEHRGEVATGSAHEDELAQALRLRVALAAARHLDGLLREIAADLSFRYRRTPDETVGMVRGRLDVQRYLRAQGKREAPRRYPVNVVERSHATPENALALYATGWVLRELDIGDAIALPPGAPELRELRERRASLARSLHHPVLSEARQAAEGVWNRGGLNGLLDSVEARVEGGRLSRPEPYAHLAAWVRQFDPRALPEADDVEWSFYDERFDTKLFEIWMLDRLERALRPTLGEPIVRPLWERGATPTFLWKQGLATVALHFQRGLSGGSAGTEWQRLDPPGPFEGVPDITVVVSTARSGESLAYVDAKLRQRDAHPTEELYKLLGYFDNTSSKAARRGAIVYYKPGGLAIETFQDKQPGPQQGRMLAIGVEPGSSDHEAGFAQAGQLVQAMMSASDPEAFTGPASAAVPDEAQVAAIQEKAVADLQLRANTLVPGTLTPYRQMLSSTIPATWPQLDEDLRTILVTAEYFGAAAPEGADLSGPLLGLSAACERLLCGPGSLFTRVASQAAGILRTPVTLGTAAMCLKWCQKPLDADQRTIQALVHGEPDIDFRALIDLRSDLFTLNDYRKVAAHIELVSQGDYRDGRALILGSGDQAMPGLLARLVTALGSS